MDRRPLDRIFFIYDHSVIKREEDDPKDAIAYFYPPKFPLDTQCLLCGQLMGMVNFLKILCSSEPRIFKLRKMKVTTKHEGNFTLALAHDPKVSDVVAIEMVKNLYDVFCMYHGSLTRVLKHCHGNRETFSSQMSSMWNCYLPFIRRYGNSMQTIFHAVPTIELPKKCGWIFLKCSHLLQWLKRKPWLLAGCLLYKNKVLCTQLTSDIMARLILIKSSQNNSAEITTDYELPFGVRILSIYLREEEYKLFAKQDNATSVGEGDSMSEKAAAMDQESRREETVSTEMHQHPTTSPQQLEEDGSNMCNKDSSESDAGQRTSSSPESSDDVGHLSEAGDAGTDSGRHYNSHGSEDDKTTDAEGSPVGGGRRTKSPSFACRCRGNAHDRESGRQEHFCGDVKVVNDVGHFETKGAMDANEYEEGVLAERKSQESVGTYTYNKANHEHSTQGATNIAFETKKDQVNGIIDHHKDNIHGRADQDISSCSCNTCCSLASNHKGTKNADGTAIRTFTPSLNDASYSDASCLKATEKDPSGVPGTSSNAFISTAVSELKTDAINSVLLPKVDVNHDDRNLEDEPFEIHINPLDSESSPEHSDSSGNARVDVASVTPRQRVEPLADGNGNILLQDDTRLLNEVDVRADGSRQAAEDVNAADGVTLRNVQDSVVLSKNNSHSRDSSSQEPAHVMQQFSGRANGEQQPSSRMSFSHSYTDQHIPQGTHVNEPNSNQAKQYSTPNASLNLSRSGARDASASSSRQHDPTHHGTNSGLPTDDSDHAKQSKALANQSITAKDLTYDTSSVLDKDTGDLQRDPGGSDQLEDYPKPSTGGLIRADGTRRRGWTRSRSVPSVTSPGSGKKKDFQGGSEEESTKVEGMVNVSLYVQAHSDTMLIFLGDKDWIQDKSRLISMWQSFVIKLADLELELQQVLNDKMSNEEQDQIYNFLQFSPFEKSLKSNTTSVMTTQNKEFVNIVDSMHEMFVTKENVTHLTIRGSHSTLIGSQNDAYQTYFQPFREQSNPATSTSSSASSSSLSSSSSPSSSSSSAMATRQGKLEAQAKKMLFRDHGIRFM